MLRRILDLPLLVILMGIAALVPLPFPALLVVAMLLGGITYPMYSLIIAYTNDYLSKEQMAAASAGLIFLNGFGAVFGPMGTGWLMGLVGHRGFFLFIGLLYVAQVGYISWRMRRRATPASTGAFRGVSPTASTVAAVAVLENAPEINPSPESPAAAAEAAEALVIQPASQTGGQTGGQADENDAGTAAKTEDTGDTDTDPKSDGASKA